MQDEYNDVVYGVAFCLTCRHLAMRTEPMWYYGLGELPTALRQVLIFPLHDSGNLRRVGATKISFFHLEHDVKAIVAVGVLAVFLRAALHDDVGVSDWGGLSRMIPWSVEARALRIPDVRNVALHRLAQLPLPFTSYNRKGFSSCHINAMTSQSFLEDGEWTGIYTSWGMGRTRTVTFDPPMEGIKFKKTRFESESQVLYLKAEGRNAVGSFQLTGGLESRTGKGKFTKTYVSAPRQFSWAWHVHMTPFGLVGNWGEEEIRALNGPGGWVWLWKKVEENS